MADPILIAPGQTLTTPDWDAILTQHGNLLPNAQPQNIGIADPLITGALAARPTLAAHVQQHPAYRYTLADGTTLVAMGTGQGDAVEILEYKPSAKFTRDQAKATAADPASQTPGQQHEAELNRQRARNAAWPAGQDPRYETDEDKARRADTTIKAQQAQAEKDRPQLVPGTVNTTSPRQGVIDPATAQVTWTPNPNYQNPDPKPIAIPGNPRNVIWDDGPGKPLRTEKNWLYEVPHKVSFDQQTGKWIDLTEDENGKKIIKDVPREIAIKPAELPVLQARYGEIAQGLGKIAEDLNAKFARGEITEQQRDAAWKAAHAQAETQVSEINSILENSKAIWSGQVTQRGHSLSETQSRRSFAESIAGRAMSTGENIAMHSGKGSGAAIAAGVGALMRMGQRYAEGMGGFRESPEIQLPAALQQAQGIGLPGYPMPGGGGPVVGRPAGPGGSTPSVPPGGVPSAGPNALGVGAVGALPAPGGAAPPSGITNTTDAGGVPREYTPAQSTVGSGLPPAVAGMGSALGAAEGYGGAPVAAGGAGMFDPNLAAQGMLGQGGDPAWEEAVRRAAQAHAQQGYGR